MTKRKSIRNKILSMVLLISILSLLLTGIMGIVNMRRIQDDSSEALTERMKTNLTSIVNDKVALAELQLNGYLSDIHNVSEFIHRLYVNPDGYIKREVGFPNEANKGKFIMQKCLLNESVTWESVAGDIGLLSNAEDIMYPIIALSDEYITCFNLATESGVILAYDTQSDIKVGVEYYNYVDTEWYRKAKENGKPCFTDVYEDAFGRGTMITCTAPFYDANDKFAGVVEMDILIEDLYNKVIRIAMDKATAILVDNSGKIVMPGGKSYPLSENKNVSPETAANILAGRKSLDYSGSGYYYAYGPISDVGWKYCVMIPDSVILKPAEAIESKISGSLISFIIIFVIIMILVFILVNRFANSITKPLTSLTRDVASISGGHLDYRATVYDNDEIGALAEKFNDMAQSLKEYITNLTAVTAEKERIGAELNVATQIQADMLPSIFPPFPDRNEFDIYATMTPAKEVGGDFYDFFLVDNDHLALVMADVSGKGVPAALFMVIAKTLIKNHAQLGEYSPANVLMRANEQLCEGNEAELFVTVWLAIIEISTGKGKAANAGHEHPVLRRKDGNFELVVYRHSPAVATMEGMKFKEHDFELHPGDTLFVYTDGVPEATDANEELFGTDRMLEALNKNPNGSPKELLTAVKASVDAFVGEAPQFDDLTMLGLKYFGSERGTADT